MGEVVIVPATEATAGEIASWLKAGAVVILPTETVYGLAIGPGNAVSARRVFDLKARPTDFNLPVVIGAVDQLIPLGVDFNDIARRLAERFWPGPLTLVMGFRLQAERPAWLEGRVEVAIRVPRMNLLRDVAMGAGPFLLTSANSHGSGPKQVAREAADSLHGTVDYIVDAGTLSPTPSTIINVRYSPARVERMGALTPSALQEFIQNGTVVPERDGGSHTGN